MKAITYTEYGPPSVLKLVELATPVPGEDEVLLKIHAASVNPYDWHFMRGTPYLVRAMGGLRKPRFAGMGVDVAGRIEAVGKNVTAFKPGDEVFGGCKGAFAEYACTTGKALVPKPHNVTWAQAATVGIAGLTALQGLRDKGLIRSGQRVLINGAAGGVGTFAVQIAKSTGAEVTGVCSSRNVEMVRSIGADSVIDYTQEDFTRGGPRYDMILDMIGNHSLSECKRALTPRGRLVLIGGPDGGNWVGPLIGWCTAAAVSLFGRKTVIPFIASMARKDLIVLGELLESGKVKPVIDRSYALSETPEAIAYVEQGHAKGIVVISVEP
jgi:NADPH:quinone reductase-like Zn-dependent oxidoreductase